MNLDDAIRALTEAGYKVSKPAAPKRSSAVAFHDAFRAAKYAAQAELGDRWQFVPGHSQWITLPASLANFRFTRKDGSLSVMIKNLRDYRAPAPRFWPGGVIPPGVVVAA